MDVSVKSNDAKKAAEAFFQTTNEALKVMKGKCAKLTLKKITMAKKRKEEADFMLQMEAKPKGLFQAWVGKKKKKKEEKEKEKEVDEFVVDLRFASRLDQYGNASYCVTDSYRDKLKDFCQCL